MTEKLNRCYWLAASAGTGSFVYASTVAGHLSPTGAVAVDGAQYAQIAEVGSPPTEWELSIGVYDGGTGTITRDTIVKSSNGGAAVDFTAPPNVRMGVPLAADFGAQWEVLDNTIVSVGLASVEIALPASVFDEYETLVFRAIDAVPGIPGEVPVSFGFQIFETGGSLGDLDYSNSIQLNADEPTQGRIEMYLGRAAGGNSAVMTGPYMLLTEILAFSEPSAGKLFADFSSGLTFRWLFKDSVFDPVDTVSGRFVAYGLKLP